MVIGKGGEYKYALLGDRYSKPWEDKSIKKNINRVLLKKETNMIGGNGVNKWWNCLH